jgi:hypothetical protein
MEEDDAAKLMLGPGILNQSRSGLPPFLLGHLLLMLQYSFPEFDQAHALTIAEVGYILSQTRQVRGPGSLGEYASL